MLLGKRKKQEVHQIPLSACVCEKDFCHFLWRLKERKLAQMEENEGEREVVLLKSGNGVRRQYWNETWWKVPDFRLEVDLKMKIPFIMFPTTPNIFSTIFKCAMGMCTCVLALRGMAVA